MGKKKRLCNICGERPATVPDRDTLSPINRVCSECHCAKLRGDMQYIMNMRRSRRAGGRVMGERCYICNSNTHLALQCPYLKTRTAQEEKEMNRDGVHTGGIRMDPTVTIPAPIYNRVPKENEMEQDGWIRCANDCCGEERWGTGEPILCHDCMKSRASDLRERWDRAFYAALTGLCTKDGYGTWEDLCTDAENLASASIRLGTASRDAAIAEVVG